MKMCHFNLLHAKYKQNSTSQQSLHEEGYILRGLYFTIIISEELGSTNYWLELNLRLGPNKDNHSCSKICYRIDRVLIPLSRIHETKIFFSTWLKDDIAELYKFQQPQKFFDNIFKSLILIFEKIVDSEKCCIKM